MAFQIECKCGKTLNLHNKMKGKKFCCPHCSLVISLKFKPKAKLEHRQKQSAGGDVTTIGLDDSQPILLKDDSEPVLLVDDSEKVPKKPKKKPPPIPRRNKKTIVYDEVEVLEFDEVEIVEDD